MTTDTRNRIIGYVRQNKQARAYDLSRALHVSRVVIHRHLKNLVEKGELKKVGKAPLVFYLLAEKKPTIAVPRVPDEIKKVIDENYLYISPTGEMLYGFEGFARWTSQIKEEKRITSLAEEYIKALSRVKQYVTPLGWIDATKKINSTFPERTYVDKLLYADFYSLPKFGKTKLGQLMLYAKQSQNRQLVERINQMVRPMIENIIKEFGILEVAFIPPTVPRNIQFMNELKKNLNLKLPSIDLVKSTGEIVVPQKTLARLEERIINARETIFMKSSKHLYSNILLIDDAAGSGATFNETANKLKSIMTEACNIIAFAIVGSIKGFEVIREV